MSKQKEDKKKSILDLIEDACEILKSSKHFFEIVIKGDVTNVKITKDNEDGK